MQVGVRMLVVIIIELTRKVPNRRYCTLPVVQQKIQKIDRLLLGNQAASYRDFTYIHRNIYIGVKELMIIMMMMMMTMTRDIGSHLIDDRPTAYLGKVLVRFMKLGGSGPQTSPSFI